MRLVVRPSGPLSGVVPVSGAKNSVLKIMAATTLASGTYTLRNVPAIADVTWMGELLADMGMVVRHEDDVLTIESPGDLVPEAPYELVERMRASIVVLGPLVARFGRARVALPGGDDFGPRPIDMHLRALEALGAEFRTEHGYVEARADRLLGTRILLEIPSVGATENALMAAVLAKGTTVIENAAREPEIADLAACLNRMGAQILGAGTPTVTIEGVDELSPVEHTIVPDRIEAATYLAAVGVAGGEITVAGARPNHMTMLIQKLGEMGMGISPDPDGLWVTEVWRDRAAHRASLELPQVRAAIARGRPLIAAFDAQHETRPLGVAATWPGRATSGSGSRPGARRRASRRSRRPPRPRRPRRTPRPRVPTRTPRRWPGRSCSTS